LVPVAVTARLKPPPGATVVSGAGWVSIAGAITLEPLLLDEDELLELLLDELELLEELELELLEELEELEEEFVACVVALADADRAEAFPAASYAETEYV